MDQNKEIKKPLLGGILRSAKRTATRMDAVDSSMKTGKCPTCGGARPEDTDLRSCAYCGYQFMSADVEIPGPGSRAEGTPEDGDSTHG